MAIAFDAAASFGDKEVNSLTWSHTCTGTDRVLIVAVGSNGAGGVGVPVQSVTYGGVPLGFLRLDEDAGGGATHELWYLVAPTTGPNNVVVTYAGNPKFATGGSQSFTGVDQTTPIDSQGGAVGVADPLTANITTVADGTMLVDGIHVWLLGAFTPGAGQTQAWAANAVDGDGAGSYKSVPTAGAATMSWGHGAGAAALSVVGLKPAGGAAGISGGGGVTVLAAVLGAGATAGPAGISGSGAVSGNVSVVGSGSVAVPGNTGSGAVAVVATSTGSGVVQGPTPISGGGGVVGPIAVAGSGQTIPPGVNGSGSAGIQALASGSGTFTAPGPSATIVPFGPGEFYPNLQSAITAYAGTDLVASGISVLSFEPTSAFQDTTVPVTGPMAADFTVDATHIVQIRVPDALQHHGVRGAGYRLSAFGNANGNLILFSSDLDYLRIVGVEFDNSGQVGGYTGRGLRLTWSCIEAVIDRCLIHSTDYYGIEVADSVSATICNTVISDNSRGGIHGTGPEGYVGLVNCTLTNNGALGGGGGVYNATGPGARFHLANCIATGNTPADLGQGATAVDSGYNTTGDASAVGANGQTNVTLVYVDAAAGDYHLTAADVSVLSPGPTQAQLEALITPYPGLGNYNATIDIDGQARTAVGLTRGVDEVTGPAGVAGSGAVGISVLASGTGASAGPAPISGIGATVTTVATTGVGSVSVPGSSGSGTASVVATAGGSGSIAPPNPVTGTGGAEVVPGVSGSGTSAQPGVSGAGGIGVTASTSGTGIAQGPAPVAGSGGVAGQVAVTGNGQAIPPGVNGSGGTAVGAAMAGSGTVAVPPGVNGSGGIGLAVGAAGTGNGVPPGVSGIGEAGLQPALIGVGTVITPPVVNGVGGIKVTANTSGSGGFTPAGVDGLGTSVVQVNISSSGSVLPPTSVSGAGGLEVQVHTAGAGTAVQSGSTGTGAIQEVVRPTGLGLALPPSAITGTGALAATLRTTGQGIVFAAPPAPSFSVVVREKQGEVIHGPEVGTVKIQNEQTTVTVG